MIAAARITYGSEAYREHFPFVAKAKSSSSLPALSAFGARPSEPFIKHNKDVQMYDSAGNISDSAASADNYTFAYL